MDRKSLSCLMAIGLTACAGQPQKLIQPSQADIAMAQAIESLTPERRAECLRGLIAGSMRQPMLEQGETYGICYEYEAVAVHPIPATILMRQSPPAQINGPTSVSCSVSVDGSRLNCDSQ